MTAGVYGMARRVASCQRCGAPLEVGAGGGYVTCAYCRGSARLEGRYDGRIYFPNPTVDPQLDPAEQEARRLELLAAQRDYARETPDPYCTGHPPPGHEALVHSGAEALALLGQAFSAALGLRARSRGYFAEERPVWWTASELARLWEAHQQPVRARAVLETGLDVLHDPGFRYLLMCQLSRAAGAAGEPDEAAQWLDQCDPRPAVLALDTAWRCADAQRRLARGEAQEVLRVLGRGPGEVAIAPGQSRLADALRSAALARLQLPMSAATRPATAGRRSGAPAGRMHSSVEVRALLCLQCGAPLEVPSAGGRAICGYCGLAQLVAAKRTEPLRVPRPEWARSLTPEQWEQARWRLLASQVERHDDHDPYSFSMIPPGYEYVGEVNCDDPLAACLMLQGFFTAVRLCRASGGAPADQLAVHALANKFYFIMWTNHDMVRAAAVVETAHEVISDPGFEQMLMSELANLARRQGDLQAADAWLSLCDPHAPHIELDCAYRLRRAQVALDRGSLSEVLTLVGASAGAFPVSPSYEVLAAALRTASLERMGAPDQAEEALLDALRNVRDEHADEIYPILHKNPAWAPCLQVWERLEAKGAITVDQADGAPARQAARARKVSRSGVIVGAGLILAGLGVASASTTIEPSAVAWVPGAALVVAGVAAMLALRKR